MNATTTTFDTEALRRGIEERDAATLRALYAPDAEMTVVDRNAPPSQPRVLRGRTAIGEYLDDTCGRDMTHRLERVVVSGDTAALGPDDVVATARTTPPQTASVSEAAKAWFDQRWVLVVAVVLLGLVVLALVRGLTRRRPRHSGP